MRLVEYTIDAAPASTIRAVIANDGHIWIKARSLYDILEARSGPKAFQPNFKTVAMRANRARSDIARKFPRICPSAKAYENFAGPQNAFAIDHALTDFFELSGWKAEEASELSKRLIEGAHLAKALPDPAPELLKVAQAPSEAAPSEIAALRKEVDDLSADMAEVLRRLAILVARAEAPRGPVLVADAGRLTN